MHSRHRSHRHRPPNGRSNPPAPPQKGRPSASQPDSSGAVEGVLDLKGRVGFILSETPGVADVIVQGASLKLAMNGDRVRARIVSAGGDRRSGEIVDVLRRARQSVVGEFQIRNGHPAVALDDNETFIRVTDMNGLKANEGDLAVVRISDWPTRERGASGTLIEVLGPRERPGVDLQVLIRKYELSDSFPPVVEGEAEAYGNEVSDDAWRSRETFFDRHVFTIDGADAKDFDDAVHIERLSHGWRLGVHIADVSHYVRPGMELDTEAARRGTSVYLTGSVLPMLPFALSANLCSLRPDRVRLTLSCIMDIDPQGHIVSHRVLESAIKSSKRFTYDEVESILKGSRPDNVRAEIVDDVLEMDKVARILRKKRFGRGSLDFDFPEPFITVGPDGRPVDIQRKARLEAHRLIEDFMLAANETVAEHMKQKPFLYRIHEQPDPAKLEKLQKTLEAVGVSIPQGFTHGKPMALQKVIQSVQGRPVQGMVQMMVLRSLKQAVYSPRNAGHFGLASPCYTHFTSPIRRYPDLIVHRLLRESFRSGGRVSEEWTERLPGLCERSSQRERLAVEAEREYLDIQKARLMENREGETFTGTISSVTNFGFFVQLDQFFVEGLVRLQDLDDYYFFDEVRMFLRGRRSGGTFRIGQRVKVKLTAANVVKRQLDFEFLGNEASAAPKGASAEKAPPAPPSAEERRSGHDRRSGTDRRQAPHQQKDPRRHDRSERRGDHSHQKRRGRQGRGRSR